MRLSQFETNVAGLVISEKLPHYGLFIAQLVIRIIAIVFAVISIAIMVTSHELLYSTIQTNYRVSTAFKALVAINIIVCALSVMSLAFLYAATRSGALSNPLNKLILLLHDTLTGMLMIGVCSAATAVGYVSQYGEKKLGWTQSCSLVPKFCHEIAISLLMSYCTFFSYLALFIIDAYKLSLRD